jgi:hypothetical protein
VNNLEYAVGKSEGFLALPNISTQMQVFGPLSEVIMRLRSKVLTWTLAVFLVVGIIGELCQTAVADMNEWDSSLAMMKRGDNLMIDGRKTMQEKKDLGSAEKMIKDGHRMMMESEKATAQIQKDTMKRGAKLMMDGLQVLKAKNDVEGAERLMVQGQKMVLGAEKMMADTRVEKMMQGSRTMMRGLRMTQKSDMNTADKLMTDGQSLMMEAGRAIGNDK